MLNLPATGIETLFGEDQAGLGGGGGGGGEGAPEDPEEQAERN